MKFSKNEIFDLIKAWVAIAIAFTIVLRHRYDYSLSLIFFLSIITVGIGFLLHELAHKWVAQKYKCFAEFKSFNLMLLIAIILSFVGFIFAAPGAVFISGHINKDKNGKISLAGPLTNIILALIFLPFSFASGFLQTIGAFGFQINSWLALFNMIPFGNLDGEKILKWNKAIYILIVIVSLILVFL